jgi:hypothetical protein
MACAYNWLTNLKKWAMLNDSVFFWICYCRFVPIFKIINKHYGEGTLWYVHTWEQGMSECLPAWPLLSSLLKKDLRAFAWKEVELRAAEAMQATCMTPSTPTGRHAMDTMALLLSDGIQGARQHETPCMKAATHTSCYTYMHVLYCTT